MGDGFAKVPHKRFFSFRGHPVSFLIVQKRNGVAKRITFSQYNLCAKCTRQDRENGGRGKPRPCKE